MAKMKNQKRYCPWLTAERNAQKEALLTRIIRIYFVETANYVEVVGRYYCIIMHYLFDFRP